MILFRLIQKILLQVNNANEPQKFGICPNDLENLINEVSEKIIDKAIDLKAIERISNNSETNFDILKNIFKVRIINLTDAYLKITKEKDKYFLQIFDENIFEEKVEINKPEELEIKLNKKRPIWA